MRLLVVDCETTGLEPETADVIEIAAALYDVGARAMLCAHSWLVPGFEVPAEIEALVVRHVRLDAMSADVEAELRRRAAAARGGAR